MSVGVRPGLPTVINESFFFRHHSSTLFGGYLGDIHGKSTETGYASSLAIFAHRIRGLSSLLRRGSTKECPTDKKTSKRIFRSCMTTRKCLVAKNGGLSFDQSESLAIGKLLSDCKCNVSLKSALCNVKDPTHVLKIGKHFVASFRTDVAHFHSSTSEPIRPSYRPSFALKQ